MFFDYVYNFMILIIYFFRYFQPIDHSGSVDKITHHNIVGIQNLFQTLQVTAQRRNAIIKH